MAVQRKKIRKTNRLTKPTGAYFCDRHLIPVLTANFYVVIVKSCANQCYYCINAHKIVRWLIFCVNIILYFARILDLIAKSNVLNIGSKRDVKIGQYRINWPRYNFCILKLHSTF